MVKEKTKSKLRLVAYAIAVPLLLAPLTLQAASLGIGASKVTVAPNETFSAAISVNTQGKTINNVEAVISFPSNLLEVTSVTGGSVLSLWVENPSFSNSNGTISFNGGAPNPGFSGSGTVANVQFRAKQAGTATLSFTSASVRENDGFGTNILSGRSGASITIVAGTPTQPAEPSQPAAPGRVSISSPTHPVVDRWYNANTATFRWAIPSGATASRTSIDNSPSGTPSVQRTPAINSISIPNIGDGVSYFHVRFLINGAWSPISTYKIQVDTVAPTNLQISGSLDESGRSILNLSADDASSGVEYFLVKKSDGTEERVEAVDNKGSLIIPGAKGESGSYQVTAVDRAGNETSATLSAIVPKGENITITEFSKEIKVGQEVIVAGYTPEPDSDYIVYFESSSGLIWSYKQKSAADGSFKFVSEPLAKAGDYKVWVEVTRNDGKAFTSEVLVIQVSQGWFGKIIVFLKQAIAEATWQRLSVALLVLLAGLGWYKYFMLRRSLLSLKQSEMSSYTKARRTRTKKLD